jgi:hypothetical protein
VTHAAENGALAMEVELISFGGNRCRTWTCRVVPLESGVGGKAEVRLARRRLLTFFDHKAVKASAGNGMCPTCQAFL